MKNTGFDLLHPTAPAAPLAPKTKLKDFFRQLKEEVRPPDIVGAIRQHIKCIMAMEKLKALGKDIMTEFKEVFELIPHINKLPTEVYCRIKLKDTSKLVQTHSYSTPRKYKEAWATLIKQHLDAGHIQPSNSAHALPAFLIPKSDLSVLPCW
jgi:hypothetical protein